MQNAFTQSETTPVTSQRQVRVTFRVEAIRRENEVDVSQSGLPLVGERTVSSFEDVAAVHRVAA